MPLKHRLFGVIGIVLCVLLWLVVWGAVAIEQQRVRWVHEFRQNTLDMASIVAASRSPEYLEQTGLVLRGPDGPKLDRRVHALLVFYGAEDWRPVLAEEYSLGTRAADPAIRERALRLAGAVLEAAREAAEKGGEIAAGPPVWDSDAVARPMLPAAGGRGPAGCPWVVYLQAPPLDLDPAETSRLLFPIIVGAGAVLLALTWFVVDRWVAGPLREVSEAAGRIADGDYSTPVRPRGGADEMEKVIAAFNAMMLELGSLQGRLKERIGEAVRKARRTQDSLVIAQRLAATGRLAAGIAHEVNNPLAGMLNAVRSLRTKNMTPEKQAEYLVLVEEGLQRIQQTVAKILQFTPHKVAPRPVELEEVVRPVLALGRHRIESEGVEVVVELAEAALVFGDLYELQQALLNVVLNALDAMGEVPEKRSELLIRTSVDKDEGEARILVRDNGPGMAEEDRDRAFDLFFTTKETGKGSGLGLATVHKIISDHGGRVELLPRAENGVDVALILPWLSP